MDPLSDDRYRDCEHCGTTMEVGMLCHCAKAQAERAPEFKAVFHPTKAAQRKATPVTTGVLDYFPDAIRAIAQCSRAGNDQHNPGKPMFWDRTKSQDEADALVRHLMERGTVDEDGVRHTTKVAWRALALLQKELEAAAAAEGS